MMSAHVEPSDAAGIADALARAARDRLRVEVRGAGTKLEWGGRGAPVDLVLSTRNLSAVAAHRHGDLTATIEAGAVLDDVNRELAKRGQWIPLDPPWSNRATIGGIVATNDSGPRRQRFGAPRDLIIGVELARADGILARAGGIVVKNVAGYDVARLVTGSFGTLGVIVAATFKLYPIAPSSRTVVVDAPSNRVAGELALALAGSQMTPTAIDLKAPPARLLIRFESSETSAEKQSADTARLAVRGGATATIARDEDEARAWSDHGRLWERAGTIARVTLLPSDLVATLDWLAESVGGTQEGMTYEIAGRAGLGVLYLRLAGRAGAEATIVNGLRQRFDCGRGSVVLLRASEELERAVGRWGSIGDGLSVMQAVKRTFDPDARLNPGRGAW